MKSYTDLIEQTFYYPTPEFRTENNELYFHDVRLMDLVEQYGTPFKMTYLPKISQNIQNAKKLFNDAIKKHNYGGEYQYCYCTKSSHFSFVIEEAMKNDIPVIRVGLPQSDDVPDIYPHNLSQVVIQRAIEKLAENGEKEFMIPEKWITSFNMAKKNYSEIKRI